jgi:hypothetical protein
MAMVEVDAARVAFVEEAAWGETPLAPAFRYLRVTGESLGFARRDKPSNEIRPEAGVGALLAGESGVRGALDFELSYGAADSHRLLAQALRGDFRPADSGPAALDVAAPDRFARAAGSFLADGFRPGGTVAASGFADPANNGVFTVASVTDAALTVSLAGGGAGLTPATGGGGQRLLGTAATLLKAGTARASMTLEKVFVTGAGAHHLRFSGCRAERLHLELLAGEVARGQLALLGKAHEVAAAPLAGASYAAGNANPALTAADVAELTVAGAPGALALSRLSLTVENNLRRQGALGGAGPAGLAYGRREVTGRLVAYFEDAALYQAFVEGLASSLGFSLGEAGGRYRFTLPLLRYTHAKVLARGVGRDLLAEVGFQALHAPAYGTELMVQTL